MKKKTIFNEYFQVHQTESNNTLNCSTTFVYMLEVGMKQYDKIVYKRKRTSFYRRLPANTCMRNVPQKVVPFSRCAT